MAYHGSQVGVIRKILDTGDVLLPGKQMISPFMLLEAIIQIASLKCPDTTHLPLPMTSSAPELVPLITVLPPSRVHYRLSTSHSTHILTQFVTSRSNRVYKDNHFFFIF